jgi:hypothetical protein
LRGYAQYGSIAKASATIEQKRQSACKPGSVWRAENPRARWPFLWGGRYQPPQATNPGDNPETDLRLKNLASPLFGFAPGGACHAAHVAMRAVRSYRTVSPLPLGVSREAVCFLWRFPWGRPRRTLSGTVSPWSPDFPPQQSGGHPADWPPRHKREAEGRQSFNDREHHSEQAKTSRNDKRSTNRRCPHMCCKSLRERKC